MPTICFFRGIRIFINWDDWRLAESKQALFPIDPIR